MRYSPIIYSILALILYTGCGIFRKKAPVQTPTVRYQAYPLTNTWGFSGDSIWLKLHNPLKCPLRIYPFATKPMLDSMLDMHGFYLLKPGKDSTIRFYYGGPKDARIGFRARLGDPCKQIHKTPLSLPFPKGKSYRIMQGNGGSFSHTTYRAYHALDFSMPEGDTVCAVADGLVVSVVKDYRYGGITKPFSDTDFANYIVIYHPASGLFSQYYHLKYDGALVKNGDTVKQGKPIGLSGSTGFSSGPHLHFNLLMPINDIFGLISVASDFLEGYNGTALKRGDLVRK